MNREENIPIKTALSTSTSKTMVNRQQKIKQQRQKRKQSKRKEEITKVFFIGAQCFVCVSHFSIWHEQMLAQDCSIVYVGEVKKAIEGANLKAIATTITKRWRILHDLRWENSSKPYKLNFPQRKRRMHKIRNDMNKNESKAGQTNDA